MKDENVKLIGKKVYEENNKLYLGLTYEYENDDGKYNLYIPKIELDIKTNDLPIIDSILYHSTNYENIEYHFETGGHDYNVLKPNIGNKEEFYALQIKTKTKKMTIEEIEKELGYKIQIVSKKEEE